METPYNTAIIDFQDTCKGPIGIDLAGLFIDHYNFEITFGEAKCGDLTNEHIEHGGLDIMGIKEAEIICDYAIWGGIQRNLRILGTLSNLYLENGRDFRLPDLPKILSNLEQIIPEKHKELKNFLKQDVNLALNQKLMELGL
jgi:aminoglycoside/choline kinase family phosphotransferase